MADNVQAKSAELAKQLWAIANEFRGNMDASEFKNYILGLIFYRYLSEKTEAYMDDLLKDDGITYAAALADSQYAEIVKGWSMDHLGYIILPENMWASLIDQIKGSEFTVEDLEKAVNALTASTIGQDSEAAFRGLFNDMNLKADHLGREVSDRSSLISRVMLKIDDLSFNVKDTTFDYLGTAYMILIGLFQSGAGKKAGEFFTATCASVLVAKLATVGLTEAKNVCDPCAGSGSLLLEVKNNLKEHKVGHFYSQELNSTTYNLNRMNMLLHGVPYRQFTAYNDDTLKRDNFYENGAPVLFDVQVSNPPYSAPNSAADSSFLDDVRYSACGVLAPKTKADLQFVEHMVYHMAEDGRIAVLLPHGVLFRGAAEEKIRRWLIESQNVLDAVVGLPANLFHGTSIPVALLVFKKKRNGNSNNILFIDASKEFEKGKEQNVLRDIDIEKIVSAYINREDIEKYAHVATMDELIANDYNLNIPRYVDTAEKEQEIDLAQLTEEMKKTDEEIATITEELRKSFEELGIDFPF